jgi:hypothetical protein
VNILLKTVGILRATLAILQAQFFLIDPLCVECSSNFVFQTSSVDTNHMESDGVNEWPQRVTNYSFTKNVA